MKEIDETVVGLKTYGVEINDKKMKEYIRFTESHNDPNYNIWAFIIGLSLFLLNLYGKLLKNAPIEEY